MNNQEKLSVEEYQSSTGIQNKEEAKKYLKTLRMLFWLTGSLFLLINITSGSNNFAVLMLTTLLILVFIPVFSFHWMYCLKVLRATRLATTSLFLLFFFAPLSWIFFYPELTKPLKIILGEIPPPSNLPKKKYSQKESPKKEKRYLLLIFFTVFITLSFFFSLLFFIGTLSESENLIGQLNHTETVQEWNFQANFPGQPVYDKETLNSDIYGDINSIIYASENNLANYFIFISKPINIEDVITSDTEKLNAINKGRESLATSILNGKIIEVIEYNYFNDIGLKYKISGEKEIIEALDFFHEGNLFTLMVHYSIGNTPDPTFEDFIKGFKFLR